MNSDFKNRRLLPLKCDNCGSISSHKCNVRSTQGKCDVCGERFALREDITNADKSSKSDNVREPVVPGATAGKCANSRTGCNSFECDICGAMFAQVTLLKIHTHIHTKEKPEDDDTSEAQIAQGRA